jgi:hypothetical protein
MREATSCSGSVCVCKRERREKREERREKREKEKKSTWDWIIKEEEEGGACL